jgi:hypothetical protein
VEPDRVQIEATVRRIAAIERPSASAGEREAAEWITTRLNELGASTRIEDERAHGTYWWPAIGQTALAAAGGFAALRGRRAPGAAAAAVAAAAMYDDVTGGPHWFRRLLPWHDTCNVVAEAGDPEGGRTLVFVAHHDAAHGGAIFDDRGLQRLADRFPDIYEQADEWPPVAGMPFGIAVLIAAAAATGRRGLLRAGLALNAVALAAFADIASRPVVPGANDNATAVAVLLELARSLQERPLSGLRVLLVSTGSEESYMEGMRAFARRHFPSLPRESTTFVCVDTVGSDAELVLVEGEGMIGMRSYPSAVKELVAGAAARAGVHLRRGLKLRFATDGLIPLRAGYPVASIGSCNRYKLPSNYHKPTDTADNVDYEKVADCARMCDTLMRELAEGQGTEAGNGRRTSPPMS